MKLQKIQPYFLLIFISLTSTFAFADTIGNDEITEKCKNSDERFVHAVLLSLHVSECVCCVSGSCDQSKRNHLAHTTTAAAAAAIVGVLYTDLTRYLRSSYTFVEATLQHVGLT